MSIVGSETRVTGYGTGDEVDGYNAIKAVNDAEIKRALRGFDVGVIDNSFLNSTGTGRIEKSTGNLKLTATSVQNITLGTGIATAYGYDLAVDSDILLPTAIPPAAGTKYLFVYASWNLGYSVAEFNIGLFDNGSRSNWTPSFQDNLSTNGNGSYIMPLYRIAINTSGTVTSSAQLFSIYKGVQNSKYAEQATASESAVLANKVKDEASTTTTEASFYVGTKKVRLIY